MLLPFNFTMKARILPCIVALGFSLALVQAADSIKDRVAAAVDNELPSLVSLYKHLHANPELSFMEVKTAKRLAFAAKWMPGSIRKRGGIMTRQRRGE